VVHVRAPSATFWDFGRDYYGSYVDQDVVDAMIDQGVMELTGAFSVAEAWRVLVRGYVPGRAIAVKVNFNNCLWCDPRVTNCEDWQLKTDALIHPVNAVIRGLALAYPDFDPADVWVYDATIGRRPPVSQRRIPQRFKDGCRYPGVRFFDQGCSESASYDSADATAWVAWNNPQFVQPPPPVRVTDVLVNATYVINVPMLKRHIGSGVTLSFKNHFGSIAECYRLHPWVSREAPHYSGVDYSPLVDLYRNPSIVGKTVLTIGDGLFGNWDGNERKSRPWRTFGDQAPNSLFLATDPVALDSVMADLLDAERTLLGMARDYLAYAEGVGLGIHERGDPWGSGYGRIDYRYVHL
jgi:hypothetical protein